MPDVVIGNPILNSPYTEPARHFRFSDDGITNGVVQKRRISSCFTPIAHAEKKAGGTAMLPATERTTEHIKP